MEGYCREKVSECAFIWAPTLTVQLFSIYGRRLPSQSFQERTEMKGTELNIFKCISAALV